MNSNEITETIDAAGVYLKSLESLKSELEVAEEQIRVSSEETQARIERIFKDLLVNLKIAVKTQCEQLLHNVKETERCSLLPLKQCHEDISGKIAQTKELVEISNRLLGGEYTEESSFRENASLLGALPQIPELKEVPCISLQYDRKEETKLYQIIPELGKVSKIAPVQIHKTSEKPGAILIQWRHVDGDPWYTDIEQFRLQKAFGDVISEKNQHFTDCFRGLEGQFLVRDVCLNQPYTFRVSCKFEDLGNWSPWSVPQVASTTLKPPSWNSNSDFILSNDNQIAEPLKDSPSLLVSNGAHLIMGQSVEFTYLEHDNQNSSVALIVNENNSELREIKAENAQYFSVESNGEIIVDGITKSTKLPVATKGLKICFTCEVVEDNKIKIDIDCANYRVTYYWKVPLTSVYFAAQLQSKGTKIMIE